MLLYTAEEHISYLKHNSCAKPLLFTEGKGDIKFFTNLTADFSIDIDIDKCNGRIELLKLFSLRGETKRKLLFFADKDSYVFDKVPTELNGVLFTDGYSLENDIINDSIEFIKKRLKQYYAYFEEALLELVNWFASAIDSHTKINEKAPQLLDENVKVKPEFKNIKCANKKLVNDIKTNCIKYFQGHCLLSVLSFVWNYAHNKNQDLVTKFTNEQLFELLSSESKKYRTALAKRIKSAI